MQISANLTYTQVQPNIKNAKRTTQNNSVPRVNESVIRCTGSVRNDHIQNSLVVTSSEQKHEHILMNLFIQ